MFKRIGVMLAILMPLAAAALEDPMRPPSAAGARYSAAAVTTADPFVLSATTIARDRRVAVINGKSVGVGGRIGEAQVMEILPTQVRLQQGGKEWVVRLLPVSVKTPAQPEKRKHE